MNCDTMLLAMGWLDTAIVGAILLAAIVFLGVLTVRFFRGQTRCSCDRRHVDCPATKVASALDKMADTGGQNGNNA